MDIKEPLVQQNSALTFTTGCHFSVIGKRVWQSGLWLTKLLGFTWEENGWCHLLSLSACEFNYGKLLFVPDRRTNRKVRQSLLFWSAESCGNHDQWVELTWQLLCGGSRFHNLCLQYQVEDSQGGNIWSWGQGASAGSCLNGLGLTTVQSRAEQSWLYLHAFGSKGSLVLCNALWL